MVNTEDRKTTAVVTIASYIIAGFRLDFDYHLPYSEVRRQTNELNICSPYTPLGAAPGLGCYCFWQLSSAHARDWEGG
jgi:hypothetical protein